MFIENYTSFWLSIKATMCCVLVKVNPCGHITFMQPLETKIKHTSCLTTSRLINILLTKKFTKVYSKAFICSVWEEIFILILLQHLKTTLVFIFNVIQVYYQLYLLAKHLTLLELSIKLPKINSLK